MRSTAYGTNNSSKAITIILCLCIIAAAIWAATSDTAGGYISEKLFQPLFSKSEAITASPAYSTAPSATANTVSNNSSAMVSAQLNYTARTIYAIQVGAFSSYENAQAGAKDVIANSGAGYIITKDGFHKLYTSAFLNEADAQSYKTLLLSQGIDACMASIEIDGVQLDITASQNQIDAISNAHNAWINASVDLFDLQDKLQNNEISSSDALTAVKSIHAEIQTNLIEMDSHKDLNNVTANLYENLELCDTQLSSFLSATLSDAEISSSIKYLMMDFIYRFGQYSNEISA